MTVIGIFWSTVLQVKATFKRSIILRPLAWNPLVHGKRVVAKEPLNNKPLFLVGSQRVIAVEYYRGAAIFDRCWHSNWRDANSSYACFVNKVLTRWVTILCQLDNRLWKLNLMWWPNLEKYVFYDVDRSSIFSGNIWQDHLMFLHYSSNPFIVNMKVENQKLPLVFPTYSLYPG